MTSRSVPKKKPMKDRIVGAALDVLREDGFDGASARVIARRGGFNQALIFYHFGTLNDLLLAALDRTGEEGLERYQLALNGAPTTEEKLRLTIELYREDLASGRVTVVSEMIGGSLGRPDLGPEVVARMDPWVRMVEEAVGAAIEELGLGGVVSARAAATALVALALGVDLIHHLEADHRRTEELFGLAEQLTRIAGPLLGQGGKDEPRTGRRRDARSARGRGARAR